MARDPILGESNFSPVVETLGIGFLIFVMVFFTAVSAGKIPTVYFSWETKDCVKVDQGLTSTEIYTCEDYPKRFHHGWVE